MSVIDEIIDDLQRQRDQVKAAYDEAETDRDVYGSAIRDRDQKREFFRQIKEVLDDLTRKQKDLEERLRFWEKMRDATGKVKKAIDRAIETIPTLTEPDVPIPDALPGRLWQGLSVGGGQFGLGPLPGLGSGFAGLLGSRGGRGARSSGMGGTVSGPMAGGNPGSGGGFDTGAPGGGFMPGVDSGGGYSGGGGGGTGTSPGPSRPTGQPGTPGPTTSPGTGTSGATREPGRSTQGSHSGGSHPHPTSEGDGSGGSQTREGEGEGEEGEGEGGGDGTEEDAPPGTTRGTAGSGRRENPFNDTSLATSTGIALLDAVQFHFGAKAAAGLMGTPRGPVEALYPESPAGYSVDMAEAAAAIAAARLDALGPRPADLVAYGGGGGSYGVGAMAGGISNPYIEALWGEGGGGESDDEANVIIGRSTEWGFGPPGSIIGGPDPVAGGGGTTPVAVAGSVRAGLGAGLNTGLAAAYVATNLADVDGGGV